MAAKPDASIVAAADRPLVLAKFKKQPRARVAKKSRTAHARHVKKSASKASSKSVAQKPAAKEAPSKTAESRLPPEVANARAQAFADDEARNIAALDSTDVTNLDRTQLAAADQPNDDADKTPPVTEQDSAPAASPAAVAPPPPVPNGKIIRAVSSAEKPAVKADDSDPWSKTSLIGKIFIAFGSLLTLASAARLFIA
jgi:hypothetical protein